MKCHRSPLLAGILVAFSLLVHSACAEELFLVSGKESIPVKPMSDKEIKKLFLSAPVVQQEIRLIPLINCSDTLTYQVFLQVVMGRSAYTYEKQLLTRFYTSGIKRPRVIEDKNRLYEILNKKPGAVSFMLGRDINPEKVRKIQKLWEGKTR